MADNEFFVTLITIFHKKKKKVINKVVNKREHIPRTVLTVLHSAPPFRAIKQFACLHGEG